MDPPSPAHEHLAPVAGGVTACRSSRCKTSRYQRFEPSGFTKIPTPLRNATSSNRLLFRWIGCQFSKRPIRMHRANKNQAELPMKEPARSTRNRSTAPSPNSHRRNPTSSTSSLTKRQRSAPHIGRPAQTHADARDGRRSAICTGHHLLELAAPQIIRRTARAALAAPMRDIAGCKLSSFQNLHDRTQKKTSARHGPPARPCGLKNLVVAASARPNQKTAAAVVSIVERRRASSYFCERASKNLRPPAALV